jgi:hypothetical protein
MAIQYFQVAGLLPNLQSQQLISETKAARSTFWTVIKEAGGRTRSVSVDTTFADCPPAILPWKSGQHMSLGDLAIGFFQYYGHEFDSSKEAISVVFGGPLPRKYWTPTSSDPSLPTPQVAPELVEEGRHQGADGLGVESRDFFEEPRHWTQKLIVQDPFILCAFPASCLVCRATAYSN